MTGRPGGADLRQRHRRPAAFCEVSSVGTYVGLMPRRFQSGKDNHTGHVSKHGQGLRTGATHEKLWVEPDRLLLTSKQSSTLRTYAFSQPR